MNFLLLLVLLALIGVAIGIAKAIAETRASARSKREIGWLYFIGNGRGPIKVGITRDSPEERCADLQTGNPTPLRVLYAIAVQDLEAAEGEAHNLLADHHVGGEWYQREATLGLMWALQREEGTMDALTKQLKGGVTCRS
jgi:hypothetical protein